MCLRGLYLYGTFLIKRRKTMKVFILEFEYFDGANWSQTHVEISATNKVQLIKAFLNETIVVHHETQKELWNRVKHNIEEGELKFPLIKSFCC